jgi:hypothetical protein
MTVTVAQLIRSLQCFDGNKLVGFTVRTGEDGPETRVSLLGVCLVNEYSHGKTPILAAQHIDVRLMLPEPIRRTPGEWLKTARLNKPRK